MKTIVVILLGVIVTLLGMLWLVQGLGIIQIDPILCAGDCEPITGRSIEWTVIGAITLLVGSALVRAGLRGVNR
jgi:formate-dependent nitrite reductase membrane component NrfD